MDDRSEALIAITQLFVIRSVGDFPRIRTPGNRRPVLWTDPEDCAQPGRTATVCRPIEVPVLT